MMARPLARPLEVAGWMVAKYPVGTEGVDYHLVVTLPGSQAEEEMPASAKVAPEPEAEP